MASSQSLFLNPTQSRRLSKAKAQRRTSMDLPERLRGEDDENEDISKPDAANPEAFVQQSMYGIIAAAHAKGGLGTKLMQDEGSDTDTEVDESRKAAANEPQDIKPGLGLGKSVRLDRTTVQRSTSTQYGDKRAVERWTVSSSARHRSQQSRSEREDSMTQSQILPPKPTTVNNRMGPLSIKASVLDLKPQTTADATVDTSEPSTVTAGEPIETAGPSPTRVTLPSALAEIFRFDEPEEVVSEYACWYLQSLLLQGYMYITQKHLCFYAYLQKKGSVVKSGHLGKQGKRNPRYRRYWFTLRGNTLSYFSNPAEPYFPSGSIDLRYGISAELAGEPGQDPNEATTFTVTTNNLNYYFRADSAASAKEWVKQVQRVIFRSNNDSDSVKISIPLKDVLDIEGTSTAELADTIKLRVIDNKETYAINEYFFTFFGNGKDALRDLRSMTDTNKVVEPAKEPIGIHGPLQATEDPSSGTVMSPERPLLDPPVAEEPFAEPVPSVHPPTPANSSSDVQSRLDPRRRSREDLAQTQSQQRGQNVPLHHKSRSRSGHSSSSSSPRQQESIEAFPDTLGSIPVKAEDSDRADQEMSVSQILTAPTIRMSQSRRTFPSSSVGQPQPTMLKTASRSSVSVADTAQTSNHASTMQTDRQADGSADQNAEANLYASRAQIGSRAGALQAAATPLQQAFGLADAVRMRGRRMGSYLSSSPKDYYGRFSGAVAGGKRHYSEADGLDTDDITRDTGDEADTVEHERRFQQHFTLPRTERLRAVYFCWLHRVLPLYGKIYISDRRFCFRSLLYGTRTKLVVPFRDIDNIEKEKGFRWGYPGMVLVIRGHEELFFDFSSREIRDDCVITVLRGLDVTKSALESILLTEEEKLDAEEAAAEHNLLREAWKRDHKEGQTVPTNLDAEVSSELSVLFDDPNASVLDFRPKSPMRITCLTIGSRGDVQPYIALCKGLVGHGHKVKIATHGIFEEWIRKHGIDFAPVEGDPAELMRLCVELGMFSPSFILETNSFARGWLDKLLQTSWMACQDTDLLIESPSAMGGIHIAEALGIPYFRAFTMPWTKTRAYPHAFATPNQKMGGKYNYMTYVIFENVFWQLTAGQMNRWRRKVLKLQPTDLGKMQINKVPFLYNFSPSVVIPPLDFSDWIRVTGYWFLDEANDWTPPDDLLEFISRARSDNMKLVYIGFGSIPMSDATAATRQIIDAVTRADVRCIFSKGWSDHFDKTGANAPELPSAIYQIRSAPHDWLFKQIDCAVHHGGAGTTGASLRAGVPTVIKPFFGDQYFFAGRVEDLGVGIHVKKLTALNLGKAIWIASHDERMRVKARELGERIRGEDGVGTAINAIYRDLEYAKSLIKRTGRGPAEEIGEEDDAEESWTFVENEGDSDATLARRTSGLGLYNARPKFASGILPER